MGGGHSHNMRLNSAIASSYAPYYFGTFLVVVNKN
jgi:hypothetical protein